MLRKLFAATLPLTFAVLTLLVGATSASASTITALVKTGGDTTSPDPLLVVGGLAVGALSYVDRTATWSVVPAYLLGADYIQTENDDKNPGVTGEQYAVTIGTNAYLHVFVDQRLAEDESIVFNAGNHTEAVRLSYADFDRRVKPVVASFGEP